MVSIKVNEINLQAPFSFGPSGEVWRATLRGEPVVTRIRPAKDTPNWPRLAETTDFAAVAHPNIERFITSTFDADGRRIDVFELLPGVNLAQAREMGRLGQRILVRITFDIASALHRLHRTSPISPRFHGDISPTNIMVTDSGRSKLIDLSLTVPSADSPSSSMIFGTLPYLAPEVLEGQSPDTPSEVFALALVVLSAVTGKLPWAPARSPQEAISLRQISPPESLLDGRIDTSLRRTLEAMLELNPVNRPSAGWVVENLSKL